MTAPFDAPRSPAEVWTGRLVWVSAMLLAVAVGRNAWQAYDVYRQLPAAWCPQPVHDFGTMFGGDAVSHRFELKNVGRDPLTIRDVHAECGCTTVRDELKGRVVPPGDSIAVPVTLQTGPSEHGPLEKRVVVRLAGEPARTLTLKLKGSIERLWDWSPAIVRFDDVSRDRSQSREIRVRHHPQADPAELTQLSASAFLEATFRRDPTATDGRTWIIEVRPSRDAPSGRHKGTVHFNTTDAAGVIGPIHVTMTIADPPKATAGPSGRTASAW